MPLGYDAPPTMDTKMDVRMPLNQTVMSGLYSKQTRDSQKNRIISINIVSESYSHCNGDMNLVQ